MVSNTAGTGNPVYDFFFAEIKQVYLQKWISVYIPTSTFCAYIYFLIANSFLENHKAIVQVHL